MKDISILIKPVSGMCNMRCSYCFYADEMSKRETGACGIMDFNTAKTVIERAYEYCGGGHCSFIFQGGEPTLAGLDYFRKFTDYTQELFSEDGNFSFSIQTNGLVVGDEWCELFKEKKFLVGLSMDGTPEIHNLNRKDASDNPTHNKVLACARKLTEYGIPFNILSVVTSRLARNIDSVYSFYKKNNLRYQQYIACLDSIFEEEGKNTWSLSAEDYGKFLIRLFRLWCEDRKKGEMIYIPYFETLLGILSGEKISVCGMTGTCLNQNVIEADGSVYPCDFYCLDGYCLGNIRDESFEELDIKKKTFFESSRNGLDKCFSCRYGALCRGGCRRDRQKNNTIGENRFCRAYEMFFDYALKYLRELV